MRVVAPSGVQRDLACMDAIPRIIVEKRRRARLVVSGHFEHEAFTRLADDACRPDLDLDGDDLAGLHLLDLIVGVEGPVGRRAVGVELAVGDAQPAAGDGDAGVDRALEGDFVAVRGELAEDGEEVGVTWIFASSGTCQIRASKRSGGTKPTGGGRGAERDSLPSFVSLPWVSWERTRPDHMRMNPFE